MTTNYQIEKGVPIPERGMTPVTCPERIAVQGMEVGDSILIIDHRRVRIALARGNEIDQRRYVSRKMGDGTGWRVWRIE